MNSIGDIGDAIEAFRRAGRLPELREALRAIDANGDNRITFAEMRSNQYLTRYCVALNGSAQQGYYCSDGETPQSGTGYGFRLDMSVAARDAANEYLQFRRENAATIAVARPAASAVARGEIASLNEVLAAANLPQLHLQFFDQVAEHVEGDYGRYNRLGYVPVAEPPSGLRLSNF